MRRDMDSNGTLDRAEFSALLARLHVRANGSLVDGAALPAHARDGLFDLISVEASDGTRRLDYETFHAALEHAIGTAQTEHARGTAVAAANAPGGEGGAAIRSHSRSSTRTRTGGGGGAMPERDDPALQDATMQLAVSLLRNGCRLVPTEAWAVAPHPESISTSAGVPTIATAYPCVDEHAPRVPDEEAMQQLDDNFVAFATSFYGAQSVRSREGRGGWGGRGRGRGGPIHSH